MWATARPLSPSHLPLLFPGRSLGPSSVWGQRQAILTDSPHLNNTEQCPLMRLSLKLCVPGFVVWTWLWTLIPFLMLVLDWPGTQRGSGVGLRGAQTTAQRARPLRSPPCR